MVSGASRTAMASTTNNRGKNLTSEGFTFGLFPDSEAYDALNSR